MLIKKTKFKMELMLFLCFLLLLARTISTEKESPGNAQETVEEDFFSYREDEPVEGNMLVVDFAAGSDALLNRQVNSGSIPAPTATPIPEVSPIPSLSPAFTSPPEEEEAQEILQVAELVGKKYVLEDLLRLDYLKENLYIVNATTKMTAAEFDVEYFIKKDLSVEKSEEPQILIFHTHGSEGFLDSRAGVTEDTVVGAGELLTRILREKYGYQVLHDTTVFDRKNGKDNRNYAYNDALVYLEELLKKYPTIEVIIDLHRDAGTKRVATINGVRMAKVMLFNGLCRNTAGKLSYLPNEYLKDNLAFSFQMKLIGDELYPGLMNRIFLKDYRYNMHLVERFLLVELGTEQNTVEEAKNAMEPLADVLAQVLGG